MVNVDGSLFHFPERLPAIGTCVIRTFITDQAAAQDDFAPIGRFQHFRTGIAIRDPEDFAAAVRAFDRLAANKDGVLFHVVNYVDAKVNSTITTVKSRFCFITSFLSP